MGFSWQFLIESFVFSFHSVQVFESFFLMTNGCYWVQDVEILVKVSKIVFLKISSLNLLYFHKSLLFSNSHLKCSHIIQKWFENVLFSNICIVHHSLIYSDCPNNVITIKWQLLHFRLWPASHKAQNTVLVPCDIQNGWNNWKTMT